MKWWPIEDLLPRGTELPFVPPHLIKRALSQVPVGTAVGIPVDLSDPWDEAGWPVIKEWWQAAAETKTLKLSALLRRSGDKQAAMVVTLKRIPVPADKGPSKADTVPRSGVRKTKKAKKPDVGAHRREKILAGLPVRGFVNVPLGSSSVRKQRAQWQASAKAVGVSIRAKEVLLGTERIPYLHVWRIATAEAPEAPEAA